MRIFRSDELPWWIVELCYALEAPGKRLDHGAELGLMAAVNDALAWTHDRRPYEERHRPAWESMIDDFHATANRVDAESQLGRAVKDDLAAALTLLSTPSGPNPNGVKGQLRSALAGLSDRLSSSAAVRSAWADLIAATQDEGRSAAEWAWRRNLFFDTAAHSGREVASLASTLAGILDDRLIDVTSARARLGDVEAPARGCWPSLEEDAGLTETQRLDLSRRLIDLQPALVRCVVCVSFDHARLAKPLCVTDQLTFYPAAEAKRLAGAGQLPHRAPVAGIPARAADFLPEGDDEVVAVIDLGTSNPATAVQIGSANCQALVAIVNAGLREPAWRPMTGHLLFASGWSASSFSRSDRALPSHWADPVGSRLQMLGVKVGRHLPITVPTLQAVVEASNRLLAAQNDDVDAAGRLILTVRVIEDAVAWGRVGMSWQQLAASFDAAWAEDAVRGSIFRAVSAAVDQFAEDHFDADQDRNELTNLRSMILVDQADGTFVLDLARACEGVPALASLYPVGSGPGRQLTTLRRRLSNGPSLAGHLSERSQEHRRLLARAVRCRNAAAHGGPLPEKTVESVLKWARIVATTLRNAALDALLEEESNDPSGAISAAYRRIAESAKRRHAQLAGGATIADAFFSADEA